jgi:hypothetical protein
MSASSSPITAWATVQTAGPRALYHGSTGADDNRRVGARRSMSSPGGPGGTIDADGTTVAVIVPPSLELTTFAGTVTRATGIYLGSAGNVTGGGPITFDPDFTPHPDLTFTIALS